MTGTRTAARSASPAVRAGIDPRIRARRIAVQRDAGRRRLRRLVGLLAAAGAGGAAWGVVQSPLLDVDRIAVEGADRTGQASVAAVSGVRPGDALATVDLGRSAGRIAELPWVETVDVSRGWPNTLRIRVVERTPVAALPAVGGGWLLVDGHRHQLDVVEEPPEGVVRVEVAPVRAEPGRVLGGGAGPVAELAATLPDALRAPLVALRPGGDGAEGTLRLPDGGEATVLLGQPADPAATWAALATVLERVDTAGVVVVDLRVPAAPALTRR